MSLKRVCFQNTATELRSTFLADYGRPPAHVLVSVQLATRKTSLLKTVGPVLARRLRSAALLRPSVYYFVSFGYSLFVSTSAEEVMFSFCFVCLLARSHKKNYSNDFHKIWWKNPLDFGGKPDHLTLGLDCSIASKNTRRTEM